MFAQYNLLCFNSYFTEEVYHSKNLVHIGLSKNSKSCREGPLLETSNRIVSFR